MREWVKGNGCDVNDRGRVPAEIRDAYHKVH
ncbi:Lsr2 family protein [Streptomyces sp. NBC_00400]